MRFRLLLGGAVLLVLVAAAQIYLMAGGLSQWAMGQLAEKSAALLGQPIQVERLRLSLIPPRVRATNLLLSPLAEGLNGGRVGSVQLAISPWSLLTGGARSFDITLNDSLLDLRLPDTPASTSQPDPLQWAGLSFADFTWHGLGLHRVALYGGQLTLRRGERVYRVDLERLKLRPDTALTGLDLFWVADRVTLDDTSVLDRVALSLHLTPERVRVRSASVHSPVGKLEITGDVRVEAADPGGAQLVVGLTTEYRGRVAEALSLARKLGVVAPEAHGSVQASGRLYGPLGALRWDGDVTASALHMGEGEWPIEQASARLKIDPQQVQLVHVKLMAGGGEARLSGEVLMADPPGYNLRWRGEDIGLDWLLHDATLSGALSGEGHLKGEAWGHPAGTFNWSYRNPEPLADHPDGQAAALWQRLLVHLSKGQGNGRVGTDGSQHHLIRLHTGKSHISVQADVAADGGLTGEVGLVSSDFADLGGLISLPYVHGSTFVSGQLAGTWPDFQLRADAQMSQGRVRDLRLGMVAGKLLLTRHRLVFTDLTSEGDGRMALAGELSFPPKDRLADGLTADLAGRLDAVPLSELAGLFYLDEPLELDFPVSGPVHLVRRPDRFAAWGQVLAGGGMLYGQRVSSGRMGMWIDHEHMRLSSLSVTVPGGPAEAHGEGKLWWHDGHYELALSSAELPLQSIDFLAESTPFLGGKFVGDATLTGDFSDPDLRLSGRLDDFSFYQNPVGDGRFSLALSRWQLRLMADLGADETLPAARLIYYSRLQDKGPFALAVRMNHADPVPFLRGLLPELDELATEQLGSGYRLSVSGALAAAGSIDDGPQRLLTRLADLQVRTGGGLEMALSEPARVRFDVDTLSLPPLHFAGEGVALILSGDLVPDERFDLKAVGRAASPWLDHLFPDYGINAGAAGFDLTISGGWDTPWLSGTVHPDQLGVAPPELADYTTLFTASGTVAVSGPLEDAALGTMRGSLKPVSILAMGHTIATPELVFLGTDGAYTLRPTEFTGPVGRVRVSGQWWHMERLAFEAVGTLRLAELAQQVDGLSSGDGELRVSGEWSGPWDDSLVSAGVDIERGRVTVDALGQSLYVDAANLLMNGDRLVLDRLDGTLGGGSVSAQGSLDTASQAVHLIVSLDDYHLRPFSGLSGTASGRLMLSGVLPAPTLSGELHLQKALYDRRLQWGEWLIDLIAEGGIEIARNVSYGETRLAVRLWGNRDILVENNLAELALDIDLLAGGTLADPGLVGRVDVLSGEFSFRDQTFEVAHASLDFIHPDRIDAYLDVQAQTTVQHTLPNEPLNTEPVDVELGLSGPVDQLDLTLSSRPPLPQSDLLSLLAVGRTTEELSSAGVGASEATYLVTGKLQRQLEDQVNRFTGLDQFTVDPFYADDTSAGNSARITVGKRLFKGKGRLTYSTVVDATQEPVIHFSYRLGRRFSLLLEQDEEGRKGGEIRYRIRFR